MSARFIPIKVIEPDYITLADFERNFNPTYWRKVIGDYWVTSVYLSAIYIALVFGGAIYMKTRKPFRLEGLLTVWNIGLSVMSIWAFSRCLPEFLHILGENGFHSSICEWKHHNPATAFWGFVLMLSKAVELIDTAFIVLRKSNLRFLHYYHHVTSLTSWWGMYYYYEPVQLWYAVMNSFVHSLMYPYYGLRAMKIKIPKIVAMTITVLQLLQMFAGIFINLYSLWMLNGTATDCPHRYWLCIYICLGVYGSFAVLFAKFFVDSYVVKRKVKSKEA